MGDLITLKSNMFLGALLLVLCIIFGYICMYLLLNDEKVCMQVNIAKYRKSGGKHEEMKRLCTFEESRERNEKRTTQEFKDLIKSRFLCLHIKKRSSSMEGISGTTKDQARNEKRKKTKQYLHGRIAHPIGWCPHPIRMGEM